VKIGKILIIEDDEDIQELISFNLNKNGYETISALTGSDGLTKASSQLPDLIILDRMLPEIDGIDVCRELKRSARASRIPIIMLTAKSEDSDIIAGLEVGADDYVTKPFSPKILLARVRTVLRRNLLEPNSCVSVGELTIEKDRHSVVLAGESLVLTATEFKILVMLVERPGWVFRREQLIDLIHGKNHAITDRAIDVQITNLRRKLGKFSPKIETVRGVGYRLNENLGL